MKRGNVIEFHLDSRSGVSPYLQLVHQVRHALRLGLLREGDQPPTVKDVVARPGVGTFVTGSLADPAIAAHGPLRRELRGWIVKARRAGLDEESIEALFRDAVRSARIEGVA